MVKELICDQRDGGLFSTKLIYMICSQNAHLWLIMIKSNTSDLHDYNQVKIITLIMVYMSYVFF